MPLPQFVPWPASSASKLTRPDCCLRASRRMQQQGAVVAMMGDGVNDAPVLAQAQLSIAMGRGALLTQAHADIVLLSGRLQGLVEAIGIAAKTRRIVRQNLIWATAYNGSRCPSPPPAWSRRGWRASA